MPVGRLATLFAALLSPIATGSIASEIPWDGSEATRTRITIAEVDGSSPMVVLDALRRFSSPEWTPDGSALIVNGGGQLWRLPVGGGAPSPIPIGSAGWIDINHAVSPDGQSLAFTAGGIWKVPIGGGEPKRLTSGPGDYVHAWSPDGKRLAFSSDRGKGFDLFSIAEVGGTEARLTTAPALDDSPHYSPNGGWIYFVSDRSGNRDLWRIPPSGGDAKAERVTSDTREDAAPRVSPDGKWLFYLSYPPRTPLNALDRDALIRRVSLSGGRPGSTRAQDLARVVGGHGTLGSRPFSPDGKRFAFASFEPPPPTIRIVLFTPSDLAPPSGVAHRLTQNADAADKFLLGEMARWKYPASVSTLFRRTPDGTVEVTYVKGDRPASDPYYLKASCDAEAKAKAKQQLHIEGEGHYWWTFLYLGDRPKRFGDWMGGGGARDGGGSIVNFDTEAGEIRPDLGLGVGFNATYFLKGTIHELGHALGLPHIGPDPALGLGNSLMGANNAVYAERKYPDPDKVYLDEASAAMLWKHPILSGSSKDRQRQPTVNLLACKPSYDRGSDRIVLEGKVASDRPAHSVVVLDDLGKPDDEYWNRSHAARVAADGTFRVVVDRPSQANGQFRIFFCFDNGAVTGDGVGLVYGDRGAIRKKYTFRNGGYTFGN